MSLPWFDQLCAVLAATPVCGYAVDVPAATEPTALAALALAAHGRIDAAARATDWLRQIQHRSGTVGISGFHDRPIWPTGLAILAWSAVADITADRRYGRSIQRAVDALLDQRGATSPRHELMGHDTTLVGWPWADGTHSWLEPSALAVLAMKSSGHAYHPRTREAVRLLLDRQLPSGGCNYGNTSVLGQMLLPHIQPTGLALLALAGESPDPRMTKSLKYLQRATAGSTGTASLCYAALALAAHGVDVAELSPRLQTAFQRCTRSPSSPYKLALLGLAAVAHRRPLHPRVFHELAV